MVCNSFIDCFFGNKIQSVGILVILFCQSGYAFHISEAVDKFMSQCYFCRCISVFRTTCFGIDHEVLQSATLWVIGVEGFRSVTVLQVSALLKLMIANLVHIIVAIGLVATDVVYLSTEVVPVGYFLLIGVNHFQ